MLYYLTQLTHWHWLGLAMGLVILDMLVGASFLLLWLGGCAAGISLLQALYPIPWTAQFALFGLGSIGCLVLWRMLLAKQKSSSSHPALNQRGAAQIGKRLILDTDLDNGRSKVWIEGALWQITGPKLPVGSAVEVYATEGTQLKVRPAANEAKLT